MKNLRHDCMKGFEKKSKEMCIFIKIVSDYIKLHIGSIHSKPLSIHHFESYTK